MSISRKIRFSAIFLSASLAILAVSLPAGAAETGSIVVHTADLNLASETGRTLLRQRINNAVNQACDTGWGFNVKAVRAQQACIQKAQAAAMPQIEALVQAAQSGQVATNRNVSLPVR